MQDVQRARLQLRVDERGDDTGNVVGLDDDRGRRGRQRVQAQRDPSDQRERALRAAHELPEVVAGDVLHDLATRARDRAVSEYQGDAEDEVARRAEAVPERPGEVRGEAGADRRVARRIERSRCPASASAAWSADSRIPASTTHVRSPRLVLEDAVEPVRRQIRPDPHWTTLGVRGREELGGLAEARDARQRRPSPAGARGTARALRRRGGGRQHLARIGDAVGVEGAPQPGEHLEVALREHLRHRARLVDADAVLARERAARIEAGGEDCLGELARPLALSRSSVVQHQRMQVAVARVEDVADAEAVLPLELRDPPQHPGQLRPRHDAVLDVVVGRDPPHRGERGLAALPEQPSLGLVARDAELEGPSLRQICSTAAASSATCTATPSSSTSSTAPAPSG